MKWNLASDGNLWILKLEAVSEVGCIHTCQGLELDYIGVIIGPDLIVREGKIITDATERAQTDSSIKGYKKLFKTDPNAARAKAETIIKNTYRTLMTRGVKGCYIFCTDSETNNYFMRLTDKSFSPEIEIKQTTIPESSSHQTPYNGLNLRILPTEDVKPFVNAVPLYDLQAAAGVFSHEQQIEDIKWVELPEAFRPQQGLFVAQVVGESMNRRIPNGAWCLFRSSPGGGRQGKVVIVQHRDIADSDTGGHYTVKVYESRKESKEDGTWRHVSIVLRPDTTLPKYEPIVLSEEQAADLIVIGELIAVLG